MRDIRVIRDFSASLPKHAERAFSRLSEKKLILELATSIKLGNITESTVPVYCIAYNDSRWPLLH